MAIFLSDTHLGNQNCRAQKLFDFLANQSTDQTLFLVGDIIDDHQMKNWPPAHLFALNRMYEFKKVVYIPGNHDSFLRKFIGQWGHVIIIDMYRYYDNHGKYYIVTHGDQYDCWIRWTGFISTSWIAKTFRSLFEGMHTHIIANNGYKKQLVGVAKDSECIGVICGHSHAAEQDVVEGVEYWNCGCWTEDDCTAIVEHDGVLKLVRP